MDSKKVTNFLLFVIAACLLLIVVRLYDDASLIAEAHAQPKQGVMKGCYYEGGFCTTTDIQVAKTGVVLTKAVN